MSLCPDLGAVSPLMANLIPVFQSNLKKLKCILVLYFFMRSGYLKCPLVKSFSVVWQTPYWVSPGVWRGWGGRWDLYLRGWGAVRASRGIGQEGRERSHLTPGVSNLQTKFVRFRDVRAVSPLSCLHTNPRQTFLQEQFHQPQIDKWNFNTQLRYWNRSCF